MVNTDRGGIVGDRLPQVESKSVLRRHKIQKEAKIKRLFKEIEVEKMDIEEIKIKLDTGNREYVYYCPECKTEILRTFKLGEQSTCLESFCEKTGKNVVMTLRR